MNADENRIFLRVLNCYALVERNKNVGRACHHDLQIRFAQFAGETFGDIERRNFLRAAEFAVSAIVFATMSSIDDNSAERFARIFCADFRRSRTRGTSGKEARKAKN